MVYVGLNGNGGVLLIELLGELIGRESAQIVTTSPSLGLVPPLYFFNTLNYSEVAHDRKIVIPEVGYVLRSKSYCFVCC